MYDAHGHVSVEALKEAAKGNFTESNKSPAPKRAWPCIVMCYELSVVYNRMLEMTA